jgi:hypothetical protein
MPAGFEKIVLGSLRPTPRRPRKPDLCPQCFALGIKSPARALHGADREMTTTAETLRDSHGRIFPNLVSHRRL